MNQKEIKELIELISSKETIGEFEIERAGVRLRIKRSANHYPASVVSEAVLPETALPAIAAAPAGASLPGQEGGLHYVTSPIVGTFYRASSPTSEPFVNVGDRVEKGSVLCIIEAMKLMNEIESEVAGEVTAIFVENGRPVEYGERLFAVRHR